MRLLALLLLTAALTGCATVSPNTYTDSEAMQIIATYPATVVHVRPVEVKSSGGGATAYGMVLGGFLAHDAATTSRGAATLAGMGVGGTAAHLAAKAGDAPSLEIVVQVRMNSQVGLFTVVQGNDLPFKTGDAVYLVAAQTHSFLAGNQTEWRVIPGA